jgi:hypothetical protein
MRVVPACVAVLVLGCGVHSDKAVVKAAVDVSSKEQRAKEYEATAQLLDEKPELVDELYGVMRQHPKTIDRFLSNASRDADVLGAAVVTIQRAPESREALDRALAAHPQELADILKDCPNTIESVLGASIVAIDKTPKARAALNRALTTHAEQTAGALSDDPKVMARIIESLLVLAEKKPAARKALAEAIHEDRGAVVALVKADPAFAKAIAVDLLREAVRDKPLNAKQPAH